MILKIFVARFLMPNYKVNNLAVVKFDCLSNASFKMLRMLAEVAHVL